jgi:Fe-S cluster assembly ATP-binding protein
MTMTERDDAATTTTHQLEVRGLEARAGSRDVLHGVDLTVRSGEVHAVMGPNGSGKSTLAHALIGRPGTTVTGGSVQLDGTDLLELPSWRRARAGLFVALQQPLEVPGVRLGPVLAAAGAPVAAGGSVEESMATEADAIGFDQRFLQRALNVDLSGGERKRNEMVQLGVLRPSFAVLDEIDSGLDVDALSAVGRRLEQATEQWGLGVVVVTHFVRILHYLRPDRVHVLVRGRIAASGGPELAGELEESGYGRFDEGAGPRPSA